MTSYSMIKVGNDYVVQANDKCILKVGSRRRAAQLINDATDLLNALAAVEAPSLEAPILEAPILEAPILEAPSLAPEAPSIQRETPEVS